MTNFNKEQTMAVDHREGPMIVVAGPGSGKTTVLTHRIRRLVHDYKVPPENILVITFTKAAAREMEARYRNLLQNGPQQYCRSRPNARGEYQYHANGVVFGTFHSVFLKILKEYGPGSGYLRIPEEGQAVRILREAALKKWPDLKYTSDYYDYVLHEIGRIKNGMESADPNAAVLLELYDAEMRRRGLIDFDDMLIRCRDLITARPDILSALRKRFTYLMVDEFQDINPVQFDIIRQIASPLNNLFIVGDDDQSIYAFRGSDPSIMLSFQKLYPDAAFVELTQNYRSSKNIVRASARLIRHNKKRYQKKLRTENSTGERPKVLVFQDPWEEAAGVLADIAFLPAGMSAAVLFRTHKAGYMISRLYAGIMEDDPSVESESALNRRERTRLQTALKDRDLRLMTFHASKGLEFDAVYIIRAEEAVTPGRSGNSSLSGAERKRLKEELEEERRMFYVALTRARDRICISYTRYHQRLKNRKSCFITESSGLFGSL